MAGHSRKKLDLTGQRFGKLTVLAPAENIGSHTAWLCRCDCGQETVVATRRLRAGRRISCGCDKDGLNTIPGGAGRASLTFVDGTCVEMIRASTVRCNNTSGVPGVEWWKRKGAGGPPFALKESVGTWAATPVLKTPSRLESKPRRSCISRSWLSMTRLLINEGILPFLPHPRGRPGGVYVQTEFDDKTIEGRGAYRVGK